MQLYKFANIEVRVHLDAKLIQFSGIKYERMCESDSNCYELDSIDEKWPHHMHANAW